MVTTVEGRRRATWAVVLALVVVVLAFLVVRLATDVPHLTAGTVPPPGSFQQRYVAHPWPAYGHILPGVLFLLGALLQLSGRVRARHLPAHRRLGRVLLVAGLVSGVLAVLLGLWFPFGGPAEATASVVFGVWFTAALVLAWRAIRRRDVLAHRRWAVRAFAVALGVGTIRVWVGVFQALGLLSIADARGTAFFGVAFWLAFALHAAAAELYLRARPRPTPVRVRTSRSG